MKRLRLLLILCVILSSCKKDPFIPDVDPIAYYTFSGNSVDNSKYKNNGIVNGAVLTTDSFGKANSAYKFSGAYIEVPDKSILHFISGKLTITAWIKPEIPYGTYIVEKTNQVLPTGQLSEGGGTFSLDIYPGTARGIIYGNDNNNLVVLNGKTYINQGAWQHIAMTWDGKIAVLYYNGQPEDAQAFKQSILVTNGSINIGAYKWAYPSAAFEGAIDNVRVYDRCLSSAEIQDLYKNYK